jgi:gamma-aminobutyric acid receptor subunit alpha
MELSVGRRFVVTGLLLICGLIVIGLAPNSFVRAITKDELRNESTAVALIESLTNRSDSRVRPGVYGPATVVKVDLFVQSFGPLNEMQMEYSIDIEFRQMWIDPRLVFNASDPDIPVYIPYHSIEKFWLPDIYFPNEKSGSMHVITLPNKSIRIYPNGTVRYLSRMAMSLSCTMYLAKFPLDEQRCLLKVSTYSYDERELKLIWTDNDPIELHLNELNLPQFDLNSVGLEPCSESYKTGSFSLGAKQRIQQTL